MKGNVVCRTAEQLGHALLRKPNCFVFDDGVDAHIFFGGLIHQKTKIVAHGSVLSVCLARAVAWAGRFYLLKAGWINHVSAILGKLSGLIPLKLMRWIVSHENSAEQDSTSETLP